jgi:hypothetical protein
MPDKRPRMRQVDYSVDEKKRGIPSSSHEYARLRMPRCLDICPVALRQPDQLRM